MTERGAFYENPWLRYPRFRYPLLKISNPQKKRWQHRERHRHGTIYYLPYKMSLFLLSYQMNR